MRVLYLVAGSGNFYCGTCIRDTALVRGLRALNHDVEVLALYLPLFPEAPDMGSDNPIFFGGINVYLQQKLGLFRAMPQWADTFLSSRPLLRAIGKRASSTSPSGLGPMTVSMLKGASGRQKKEVKRLVAWVKKQDKFDAVCLSNGLLAGLAAPLKEATGAKVVATFQGEEGFLDALPEPYREEAWSWMSQSCADLDAMIAVSRDYGARMGQRLGFAPGRVFVAWNGIELGGYGDAELKDSPPHRPMLGYLSRMCPEKGLHHLVAAFLKLRHDGFVPDPILCIVGACTKADEPFVETMKKRIHDAGFSVDVQWHPNVVHEEKQRLLKELDVFCVPGPSDESFGLYVLEAMASGVPVLAPEHAAFPEIIGETGGGVLYDPESPEGLTSALEEILSTPEGAQGMGVKGRASVQQVFSSSEMSQRFSDILGSLSLEEPEEAPTP